MAETRENKEQDEGSPVWTVRKLRAAVLIVMIVLVAVFVTLRSGSDGDEPDTGPQPPTAGVEQPDTESPDTESPETTGAGDQRRVRQTRELDPSGKQDVVGALEAGDAALAEDRLYQPEGDSAIQHYRRVLELDPDNTAAREGLETVAGLLIQRFEDHLDKRDLGTAEEIAGVVESVYSDAPEIGPLVERLERMQAAEDAIAAAEARLETGSLARPAEDSALVHLSRAGRLDPGNPDLGPVVERFEREVVEKALSLARSDQFPEALFVIRRASHLDEDSRFLMDTADRIESFQAQRIDETVASARSAMQRARFDEARTRIAAVESLGGDASVTRMLAEELEHARVYGVFDAGESFVDTLPDGSSGPRMKVLPAGHFLMGTLPSAPGHLAHEEPRHRVEFERAFALGEYEITVEEFRRFIEATGYETDAEREGSSFVYNESNGRVIRRKGIDWRNDFRGHDADDREPVIHVSWNDANTYAEWLAAATGKPYRLPTEAEFEYVIGAGSDAPYWWGNGAPTLPVENLTGEGDRSPRHDRSWNQAFPGYADGFWGPAPVGSLAANPLGFFDLAGNVMEWVADCWHDSYVRAPSDGSAWVNFGCDRRVARGSFWGGAPETARIAHRTGFLASQRGAALGFRIARDVY